MSENKNKTLYSELVGLYESDYYPFHMPGHKRKSLEFIDPYSIDITEIGGFDNLAHPRGLIKDIEDRLASLYGCDHAFMLVNGSTCANLSMIYAANRRNGNILVARNSHKSVIHAVELKNLSSDYIIPEVDEYGIQKAIDPDKLEEILKRKRYDSFVMTSPTYEGICSDIKRISEVCHKYGVKLLVDAAHGAHLGITDEFPENPVNLGADAVAVSLHKTLPSFTQTAALLYKKESLVDLDELKDAIRIFQSSSPSYILMSGIDKCVTYVNENRESFRNLKNNILDFREKTEVLNNLKILKYDDMEESKIVILSKIDGFSGEDLLVMLRNDYHLELEMAQGQYALAMTSIMDDKECLNRLFKALKDIDGKLLGGKFFPFKDKKVMNLSEIPLKVMEISEAKDAKRRKVLLDKAEGLISYNEVCVYPPGVADLLPGEQIDKDMIEYIKNNIADGHEVEGVTSGYIYVLQEN
ncbi:MAG: aminotransferase class V-fold PLP-dependent enzyme [Lachnospiraceae bacterium]|nr:aminotransferase class V-fold PLP-dependent enzyme [Lachnospiraceae bacterium]